MPALGEGEASREDAVAPGGAVALEGQGAGRGRQRAAGLGSVDLSHGLI